DTIYQFRIRAFRGACATKPTDALTISSAEKPPASLAVSSLSKTEIGLTWSDGNQHEKGYRVERKANPSDAYTKVTDLPADKVNYHDANLRPNTTYYYRVSAMNNEDVPTPAEGNAATAPTVIGLAWSSAPSVAADCTLSAPGTTTFELGATLASAT